MKNLKGIFVVLLMIATIAMCAQPTFEVLPVTNDTTFQVKTTVQNTDDSESVTLTQPYDSTQVRSFIDIQIARNSRVLSKKVNELKALNTEATRLRKLFGEWNSRTYFQEMQDRYVQRFVGTWRLWYDGKGTILTLNEKRKAQEFGGELSGVFVVDSKEVIILRDYLGIDIDVKFYAESDRIFVGEHEDKKIFLKKISDEIREEGKKKGK